MTDLIAAREREAAQTDAERYKSELNAYDKALRCEGWPFEARIQRAEKLAALEVQPVQEPMVTPYISQAHFDRVFPTQPVQSPPLTCKFPDCNCPLDPGPEPDWCARELPHEGVKP